MRSCTRGIMKRVAALFLAITLIISTLPGNMIVKAAENEKKPIVNYNFTEWDSTIINDNSGNGKAAVIKNYDAGGFQIIDENIYGKKVKALSLPGGKDGGYLEFPEGVFGDATSITINMWVKLKENTDYQRIWDFGNDQTSYFYLLSDGKNENAKGYATAITKDGWGKEECVSDEDGIKKNVWVLTTVVLDGNKLSLYQDGKKVGTKETSVTLADLGKTKKNYLGYGQFGNDPTKGEFADVSIYNYAMSDAEVGALYQVDDKDKIEADTETLSIGDISGVTADLTLPQKGENGSTITWKSSNESVISTEGKVVRPEAGKDSVTVTLTATLSLGTITKQKEFQVTVLPLVSEEEIVKKDAKALEISRMDSIISNLDLVTKGENGSTITWTSSDEKVISTEGKVTRPEIGSENAKVTLTATIQFGKASQEKKFECTVLAKKEVAKVTGYDKISVTTQSGVVPSLPNFVTVQFSDGTEKKVGTIWPTEIDSKEYEKAGEFTVKGKLLGLQNPIEASVTVKDEVDQKIDKEADNFDLNDISLDGDSILTQNRGRTLNYLKLLDNDRMLYNFRKTFGQDTKNANPLGGWDEPTGLLRGHSTGHYLSALSLAYASTKDKDIKKKLDEMIHELRTLQKMSKGDPAAFKTNGTDQSKWSTDPNEWGEGFISAYSPDQFALLEQYTPYATIWAPYYTLHKIMAGFIDAYQYTGNKEALEAAKALGKWIYKRLSACSKEQLTKMWDMYIAGELGGMNESMAKLYEITGDKDYFEGAKLFDNTKFFDNLALNKDDIKGRHANQHIPQIIGALEEYKASVKSGKEEKKYYNIARNFWEMVVSRYAYSIGGVGTGENFKEPYEQANYINTDRNCETCAAYNMLKLTKGLYSYDPDNAEYMDYYERTLYNQIIASQNPEVTETMHHGVTYMLPIGPGVRKDYGGDYDSFTCCHGTGMENHVKYQEAAYYKSDDTLYVNLFLPSTVNWKEKGVTVSQEMRFPAEDTKLVVKKLGQEDSKSFNMKIRVPYWVGNGYSITVNGEKQDIKVTPSSYVSLSNIKEGDCIEIHMPYTYHLSETPDKLGGSRVASIMYGPFIMVAKDSSKDMKNLVLSSDLNDSITKVSKEGMPKLKIGSFSFAPMYDASNYEYHTYFKIIISDDNTNWYEAKITNQTPDYGTFDLSSELIEEGDKLVITANPKEGYKVKKLLINGKSVSMVDNTYTVENVKENIIIEGTFGLINPPKPDVMALDQTATVQAHFTAEWENLNGIKDPTFEPTSSNMGSGKGWGDWPQSAGSTAWIQYSWDTKVKLDTMKIYWYDDEGDTRVPESIQVMYLDKDENWKEAEPTSDLTKALEVNCYNTVTVKPVTTTAVRLNMKIRTGAAATGIYRWKVSCQSEIPTETPVTPLPETTVTPSPETSVTPDPNATATPTKTPQKQPTAQPTKTPESSPTVVPPTQSPAQPTVKKTEVKKIQVKVANRTGRKLVMKKNSKLKFNVKVLPKTAKQAVAYRSSNKKIVSVSSKGVITAKKPGTARITIYAKDAPKKKIIYQIKVVKKDKKNGVLKLSKSQLTIKKGKTAMIAIKKLTANTTSKITYQSKSSSIAKVNAYGEVTGRKKGRTTITVKCGKAKVKITIVIK
ncbi:putative glycosyl hydrolase of unknown function [Lachnospiraceae bacterium KM106-2]|nr:putative glycosyl hydrolase of unknown function [Lachnospiraceae bacterium KM106-2]